MSSISGTLTVDNAFFLYLSTSDSTLGTLIASGNNWQSAVSFNNVQLPSRGMNYLHLEVINYGSQYGFIGTFTLNGIGGPLVGGQFSNGSSTLSSDTTHWKSVYASTNSTVAAQPWIVPTNAASTATTGGSSPYTLGVAPWNPSGGIANVGGTGGAPAIASTALWIGDPNTPYAYNGGNFTTFFSTAFVPEPGSLGLLAVGLAGLGARRRRSVRHGEIVGR